MSATWSNAKCSRGIILMLTLVWATSGFAWGQADTSQVPAIEKGLHRGTWALQFALGSAFSRRSSEGFTISAKRHMSERSALRIGVDLFGYIDAADLDRTGYSYVDSSENRSSASDDRNAQGITLFTQYVNYSAFKKPIGIYWGLGPLVRFSRHHGISEGRDYYDPEIFTYTRKYTDYALSAGATGALGVEWFATKRISITAEYGASLEYQYAWAKSTVESSQVYNNTSYKQTARSLRWSLQNVLFGISVYF